MMRAAPLVTLLLVIVAWFANRRRKNAVHSVEDPTTAAPLAPADAYSQLGHADWRLRKQAIETLAATHDASLIPAFVQRLNDSDEDVRIAARKGLETFGEAAVPQLIEAMDSLAWEPVEQATQALGLVGGTTAMDALIAALGHRSAWVRSASARSLGHLRDAGAVPALVAALEEEDADVREVIVGALRQIGTPEALQAIER